MSLRNTETRYGIPAQILHWGMLLLFIALWFIAESFDELPKGPEKLQLIALHKSLGVTAMMLVVLRLAWRSVNPAPAAPPEMNGMQQKIAGGLHILLYVCMFAMPITGYLTSVAGGHPVEFFGLFTLPDLVSQNHDLKELAEDAHGAIWTVIMILVGLHAAAALFHHFVVKDTVLRRMLPGRSAA